MVPGDEVTVLATVRNQGEIVDTFDVRVEGLPDGWWTVTPATVFLNPWGTSGDYEQEVQVRLHPPRTPASEARAWPLTVVVRSRSLGADVACGAGGADRPAVPEHGDARRPRSAAAAAGTASFDVAVANHGNGPMEIVVGARDTEARCPVSVAPARMTVPVGAAAAALVLVDVPRPLIFRRPIDHHVEIIAPRRRRRVRAAAAAGHVPPEAVAALVAAAGRSPCSRRSSPRSCCCAATPRSPSSRATPSRKRSSCSRSTTSSSGSTTLRHARRRASR